MERRFDGCQQRGEKGTRRERERDEAMDDDDDDDGMSGRRGTGLSSVASERARAAECSGVQWSAVKWTK